MLTRLLFSISLLLFTAQTTYAQESYNRWEASKPKPVVPLPRKPPVPAPPAAPAPSDSTVLTTGDYYILEVMPIFPGGQEAMFNYIKKNLKRPPGPKQRGEVMVQFTVSSSGVVTGASVLPGQGLNPAYDAAAVEIITRLPKFRPGTRHNKAVDMILTTPVHFK
ncbi:energy transducer TonB [Hymenobacter sp. J193]|uniref:energy transducer TonB family protein n=1 Tax=Hymenobacter sp. J193 TaxID=2898429 RepID=UPI0021508450|nr:energy transducer TonB [Hymenobacter sp. J193]MCR5888092.1 energy transducer TonB [Hymenobacter sp. J193]